MQEEIKIGDINIQIIRDEHNDIYYPINFIMEKILFKKTGQASLKKEYSQYIKKFKINYGTNTGGIQNVNCIREEGLKDVLRHSKIGQLSIDQKRAMNVLLEYLHMDIINEDNRFIKQIPNDVMDDYNEYIKDCIQCVVEQEPDIIWQKCTKCNNYYPYHINFFGENPHSGKEYPLYTMCRNCAWTDTRSRDLIKHPNNEMRLVYNNYGIDIYKLYKNHETINIYNHWASINNKFMPKIINNEEDKVKIIKYYYDIGKFNEYPEINANVIYKVCKFRITNIMRRINKEIFNCDELNNIKYVKQVLDSKNVIIEDIYNTSYNNIIKKYNLTTYLRKYCNNDLLEFAMQLYDYKCPAYKFTGNYKKYWNIKENRIKALKYFIEEDMKIPLEKVPLYITLTALRNNGSTTLYTVCKKYYKNLFEWINEVYPDDFTERDFDIHYIRNNFDSIDEAEIHDILVESFKNVIYNPRNTERTININGMIPDWFIFTDMRCYIVEYFGMALNREIDNSRITEYQEKTKHKIEKYNDLEGYGKVYIYPEDLKNGFSGLKDKLEIII